MNILETPLFSIVVPVYNVEQYLDKCLDSILNQTFRNIEVILVDDGSTDSSSVLCDKYCLLDARVSVVHKKNGGLSDARNVGISQSNGKYIIFVDSDDYISLNSCEKLSEFAEEDIDIIACRGETVGSKYSLKHTERSVGITMKGPDFLLQELSNGCMPMAAWLNVYRREFLLDNMLQFKIGIYHEDEQFTPRAFLKADRVVFSNVDLYRYIVRTNSITTRKDKRKNLSDLYSSLVELKDIYSSQSDRQLKAVLYNSLASKYLSLFYDAKGYQYGRAYYHRTFVLSCATKFATFLKALLYCLSPKLYWWINYASKFLVSSLHK